MTAAPARPASDRRSSGDQRVVLFPFSWQQYEALNDAIPENVPARVIYREDRVTILVPSGRHRWFASRLDDLIRHLALALRIEWETAGRSTFRRPDLEVAVEGDRTYYFGEHARIMRGPANIDLSTQPPPDLAVEVETDHPADDAIAAWGRIGVPEVWRLRADHEAIDFLRRLPDGTYAERDSSRPFAGLKAQDVSEHLRLMEPLGSLEAFRHLPKWVGTVLVPRLREGRG